MKELPERCEDFACVRLFQSKVLQSWWKVGGGGCGWISLPDLHGVRLGVGIEGTEKKKTFGPGNLVLLRGLRMPSYGPVSMFTSPV